MTNLSAADALMLGTNKVSAVYAGANKVWHPGYAAVILADLPSAYYRLNDSSPVALDQTKQQDGSYVGSYTQDAPSLLPSGHGASLDISGGGGVTVPSHPSNELGVVPMSIECWVKLHAAAGGYACLVDNANRNYSLFFQSSSAWYVGFGGPGGGGSLSYTAQDWTLPHHFVLTIAPGVTKMYIDGESVTNGTIFPASQVSSTGFSIGMNPSGGGGNLSAQLQEFALYNYALSQQQVSDHYGAGL